MTFEEGTCAAWLYALLKQHVTKTGGVRSAAECPAENRQQERPDRPQVRRVATRWGLLCVRSTTKGRAPRYLKELSRSYLT